MRLRLTFLNTVHRRSAGEHWAAQASDWIEIEIKMKTTTTLALNGVFPTRARSDLAWVWSEDGTGWGQWTIDCYYHAN